jgi:hypothetical protein
MVSIGITGVAAADTPFPPAKLYVVTVDRPISEAKISFLRVSI